VVDSLAVPRALRVLGCLVIVVRSSIAELFQGPNGRSFVLSVFNKPPVYPRAFRS
jgi:hypothetical protein